MSRGGARPGAGRKRTEDARVILSCRVAPSTRAALEQLAEREQVGIGVALDKLCQSFRTAYITSADFSAVIKEIKMLDEE